MPCWSSSRRSSWRRFLRHLHRQALDLVDSAIASRTAVGLTGLAAAAYSGLGWMRHLREALTLQHGDAPARRGVFRTVLYDFAALLGLSVGLAASGALTFVRSGTLLTACALVANWAVFLVVLAKFPRRPVPLRSVWVGAAIGAYSGR
ncbi:YhjD/YihY/BrkB family envelope integrity protein [Amycolatopsis sp. cg13]|uniref:YhjD/YihY/BrkB family envelope integrity protein n=1 Tax=Amycolatopsis sp. cg13 TaxID=3238807 RepID=UPI003523A75B